VQYASFTEAPSHIHFWCAVSAIAGALGRKVWINQHSFNWYPNHYIFFVGPPDVISKSTTVKLAMSLLKRVPGFTLGPTSCSWQALVETMVKEHEMDYDLGNGQITKLAACTVSSTELGNFLKVKDGEFLDTMISLWDGDTIDKKLIKDGGSVYIENPLLNLNGCTTPSWMASNIPEHMLEGGLLSRVIFVYGDKIDHPVAYPADNIPDDILGDENNLVLDLTAIGKLKGAMTLSPEAKKWATLWYNNMKLKAGDSSEQLRGHLTRKQTHVHKLAMVLSVARSNSLIIDLEDIKRAVEEIEKLEDYRMMVMSNVGKTLESTLADRLLSFIRSKKACKLEEAYRVVHNQLPNSMAFLDLLNGLIKAGYVKENILGGVTSLVATNGKLD
jgi:chaperonin cofactor prefoldin